MSLQTIHPKNTDSLVTLLKKIKAILTVNDESLAFIHSRKGQKVVLRHRYCLEVKDQYTQSPMITLVDKKITKDVNQVLKAWRYKGSKFKPETICFHRFLDLKVVAYDDLSKLNQNYEKLYEKYHRLLMDQPESQRAALILKQNLECLQVAIGDVHSQVLDVKDPMMDSHHVTIKNRIQDISKNLRLIQEDFPKIDSRLRFHPISSKDVIDGSSFDSCEDDCLETIPMFQDCTKLIVRKILKQEQNHSLELNGCLVGYRETKNEKEYRIASAQRNGEIVCWDVEKEEILQTLSGHTGNVHSLVQYSQNDVPKLASGGSDKRIHIWNLETRTKEHTLAGHKNAIFSLAVYKHQKSHILLSGSKDSTIRMYDLDSYTLIRELLLQDIKTPYFPWLYTNIKRAIFF